MDLFCICKTFRCMCKIVPSLKKLLVEGICTWLNLNVSSTLWMKDFKICISSCCNLLSINMESTLELPNACYILYIDTNPIPQSTFSYLIDLLYRYVILNNHLESHAVFVCVRVYLNRIVCRNFQWFC